MQSSTCDPCAGQGQTTCLAAIGCYKYRHCKLPSCTAPQQPCMEQGLPTAHAHLCQPHATPAIPAALQSLLAGLCRCAVTRCRSWRMCDVNEVLQLRQEPSANSCSGEQCRTSCIGITRDFPLSEVFQLHSTS